MLPNSEPETELPKAQVKRIVKAAIQEAASRSGASEKEHTISKDALLAFSESAKVFVHYLTATANDICRESKRQTISGRDVIAALEDLDFKELVEPLKEAMEDFKQAKANADRAKKSKTAAATPEQESPWQGSSGARPGEPGPATPVDTAGPGSWSAGAEHEDDEEGEEEEVGEAATGYDSDSLHHGGREEMMPQWGPDVPQVHPMFH